MAETQSRIETCRRGHRWPVGDSLILRTGDPEPVCPVCGESAEPSPPSNGSGESTLISPATWDTREEEPGAQDSTTSEPTVPGYAILRVLGRGYGGVDYK